MLFFGVSGTESPSSRVSDLRPSLPRFPFPCEKIVVNSAWRGLEGLSPMTCQAGRYTLGLANLVEGLALIVIAVRSAATEKYLAGTAPDTAFPVYIRLETTTSDRSSHSSASLTAWNDWRHLCLVFQRIEQRKQCAMTLKPKLSQVEIWLQILIDHVHGRYYWVMGRVPSM